MGTNRLLCSNYDAVFFSPNFMLSAVSLISMSRSHSIVGQMIIHLIFSHPSSGACYHTPSCDLLIHVDRCSRNEDSDPCRFRSFRGIGTTSTCFFVFPNPCRRVFRISCLPFPLFRSGPRAGKRLCSTNGKLVLPQIETTVRIRSICNITPLGS